MDENNRGHVRGGPAGNSKKRKDRKGSNNENNNDNTHVSKVVRQKSANERMNENTTDLSKLFNRMYVGKKSPHLGVPQSSSNEKVNPFGERRPRGPPGKSKLGKPPAQGPAPGSTRGGYKKLSKKLKQY